MNTVGNLKDSVAGLLSGTNLTKVTGINTALERAARKLVQKADVPEASDKQALTLYHKVTDYAADTNIFGGAVVDLRPQGASRSILDTVIKRGVELFDRTKFLVASGYELAFEWNKGTPIVRIATPNPQPGVILDTMKETTDWTAAGSASGLVKDSTVYYESPSSLRFTLTGSSTGTLTKALSSELDLETYEDVGVAFLAIRIPDGATAANLTSVAIRLGSSASAYDEVSDTDGFLGAWIAGEWLLVALDFSGATATGTPDWENIDYVQVRIAHSATLANFRVGGLWIALPSPHELLYQTAAIFLNNGALSKTITDDDDEIILSDAAYLLYEHESALQVAIQSKAKESAANMRAILYGGEGDPGLYSQFRSDNPSQEIRTVGNYIDD